MSRPAFVTFLVLAGCSGGGDNAGDAGPSKDATAHDGETRDGMGDAKEEFPEHPIRTATTRALLPTSVENVLLDPFITSDESWGHFVSVNPGAGGDAAPTFCNALVREVLSQSPIGVSGSVIFATARAGTSTAGCTEILAPFVGGLASDRFMAQILVSRVDTSGAPVPLSTGAHGLDEVVTVTLLPNYLPSDAPQVAYPFAVTKAAPTTIDGRQWGVLALPEPVALPKGGWFSIHLAGSSGSVFLAAPEVVATTTVPLSDAPHRQITSIERAALLEYARRAHVRHSPSRRRGTGG